MTNQYGPKTKAADQLHAMKYRGIGEDFREAMNRVAFALKDSDDHYHAFRDVLLNQRFMPAGRIQAAMGASRKTTAYNCLSGETEILTREHGIVSIESLSDTYATVLDGNGNWTLSKFLKFGKQDVHTVSFTHGRKRIDILATADHGWIIDNKKVVTTSLKRNDRVDFISKDKNIDNPDDYKRGVIHGYVYADGTAEVNNGFSVRVCKGKEEFIEFLNGFPKSNPPSYEGDAKYYFYGENAFTDLKALPKVNDITDSYLLGFIRSWLTADGCISDQPEAILTGDVDEECWIKRWGPLVGFHVTGSSAMNAPTPWKRNKKLRNIRFDLRSIVPGDLLISKKRKRIEAYSINDKNWRVRSVSEIPTLKNISVYCAVVPTSHSFALNGGVHSSNCFVSGTIEDSFVDGAGSIMGRAHQAAATMRMGGGIGYDFSTLRPRGFRVAKIDSQSSGPVSFMPIFDAVCLATASYGHRRGAQMGVLRVDHPDIEEFLTAKQNNTALKGFNVSIAVTDTFMEAALAGKEFDLMWDGKPYKTIEAAPLWEKIMRATYDWAEPGVLFIDTINRMNNLWYAETLAATNPCGEQPLPPYGACLLGSFNLTKYLFNIAGDYEFDFEALKNDIPHVVRAMDNVVDRTNYPLPEQRAEAITKRRMGLGVAGLANAGEALGFPYGSEKFLAFEAQVLEVIRDESYLASACLAKEKGSFPLYDDVRYLEGKFIRQLPGRVFDAIVSYGIRNSHLTSIAPTGTISMAADNISSGIEPVFSYKVTRSINTPEGSVMTEIEDYGVGFLGTKGKVSSEVTAQEHVAVLTTAQKYVDSAVSKTCNVDSNMAWADFKKIYEDAWKAGAKGCTTFNADGKRFALLTPTEEIKASPAELSCEIGPDGQRSCE